MATDAFSYLEDSNDERTRAWIHAQNRRTSLELEGDVRFQDYYRAALAVERSARHADDAGLMASSGWMSMQQGWIYQVWRDGNHPRGVWRRATRESFLAKRPEWHELLDLDALGAAHRRDWTLGYAYVSPDGRRCLLQLLLAGSVVAEWREFDLERRDFVPHGFRLPASSASQALWRNDDTLLVTTDFGPGTVTALGNALIVKEWRRGEPLDAAREIFRGASTDTGVAISPIDAAFGSIMDADGNRLAHIWQVDAADRWIWWRLGRDGVPERLTLPSRAAPVFYQGRYIMVLLSDWQVANSVWKSGEVVCMPVGEATKTNPRIQNVLRPARDESVAFVGGVSSSGVLLFGSSRGSSRVWRARAAGDGWAVDVVPLPAYGAISHEASCVDSTVAFARYESSLQSPALYCVDVAENAASRFACSIEHFDAAAFVTEQLEARSADGVVVPYFLVRPKGLVFDGRASVLMSAYGAQGASQVPRYSGTLGKLWLERGGAYVVANVRGGGERGRDWHVTGVARQRTYDDMIAVAEDVIGRGVTSPKRIGLLGYHDGGLLAGVMLTQRPDLFGAAILESPLLDQFRRDLLMPAPLWDREFGSLEDPEVVQFLERTSPFQNLRANVPLPRPLLIASPGDLIVSAAQARRFAAKMASLDKPFLFHEASDIEHGSTLTAPSRARLEALIYVYLARELLDRSSAGSSRT